MNYLAHLALSQDDPLIMLGNFIADDVPRKEEVQLSPEIVNGIILHRRIDEFTDAHPAFREAMIKLRPKHRKYAPVVLDILNDHLLANNWGQFYSVSRSDFDNNVYKAFRPLVRQLPPKASMHVEALLEYEYLAAYDSRKGIDLCFRT